MRVWDAELTAKKELQPVSNGLLFWLDGRDELIGDTEYGSYTPPAWITSHMFDRISNARVDFVRSASSGGLQSTGLSLLAFNPYSGGNQDGTIETITGVKAVEIMYVKSTAAYTAVDGKVICSSSRVFFPVRSSTTGAKIESASLITNAPVHLVFQGDAETGKPVIYQNGILASVTGAGAAVIDAFDVTSLISITGGADLGCIRLYNRFLSSEEVKKNYDCEIATGRMTT